MIATIDTEKLFTPKKPKAVFQFKITLQGITPTIWRRIQVPKDYSFWDLHVAITDCMPWLDYHLHVFRVRNPKTGRKEEIGIPDDDGELNHLPGWEKRISNYFNIKHPKTLYRYDFGDGWEHEVLFEEAIQLEPSTFYPRCIAGERACPPEDVGGTGGYERFLTTISDPANEECESMLRWAEGLTGVYPFDPAKFDPAKVQFDDPDKRWGVAFNHDAVTPDMRCYGFLDD